MLRRELRPRRSGGNRVDLFEVVEVVTRHSLDDRLKRHVATLRMTERLRKCGGWQSLQHRQIPAARRGKEFERGRGGVAGVDSGPLVLVEGLDDVMLLGCRL